MLFIMMGKIFIWFESILSLKSIFTNQFYNRTVLSLNFSHCHSQDLLTTTSINQLALFNKQVFNAFLNVSKGIESWKWGNNSIIMGPSLEIHTKSGVKIWEGMKSWFWPIDASANKVYWHRTGTTEFGGYSINGNDYEELEFFMIFKLIITI